MTVSGREPQSGEGATRMRPGSAQANESSRPDQLELVPVPRCSYCGHLAWTEERYGRLTHKHDCPHRTDPYCQAHASMCGEPVIPRKNPDWPKTSLYGETFEDIFISGDAA